MNEKSSMKIGVFGMLWMSISSVATMVVNLLLTMVLARLLTADDYGIYQAIVVLVGLADMLWQLGIGPALVRKKDLERRDIVTGQTVNILLGVTIAVLINVFTPQFCKLFAIDNGLMLRVYSIIFIVNTIVAVPKAMMQRECKFKLLAICVMGGLLVHAVVAIILALLGFGAWALVLSIVAQYVAQMIFVLMAEKIPRGFGFSRDSAKELLTFGGGFTLSRFFNYIALQGDNYVVNKTLGTVALGYYGKAYNLLGYPANLIGQTIDQVLYPLMSREQDNLEKMGRVFCSGNGLIGLAVIPISVVALTCRNELVVFVLGNQWMAVVEPMAVMICGLYFRTAYKLGMSLIRSLGRMYTSAAIQFVYAVCVLGGAYLGHAQGLVGVAAGVTLAFSLNCLMTMAVACYFLQIKAWRLIRQFTFVAIYSAVLLYLGCVLYDLLLMCSITNVFFLLLVDTVLVVFLFGFVYMVTHRFLVPEETHDLLCKIVEIIGSKIMQK